MIEKIRNILSDDSIKEMANKYTGSEEEYQGFVLACQVVADEIEDLVKNYSIPDVIQQRELFKSFLEKVVEETEVGDLTWQTRDEAKKLTKLFNCS
jgi:predicted nucleic acid-binding protein